MLSPLPRIGAFILCYSVLVEAESYYTVEAKASLELVILLLQPPQCQDCRWVPPNQL